VERRSRPTDVWPGVSPPLADVERRLLDAIARAPGDDQARLILADYWMQGSDPARGEFVALQCGPDPDAADELRELYEQRWLGALAERGYTGLELVRGFIRYPLVLYADDPLASAPDTRRVSPQVYLVTERVESGERHARVFVAHSQDGERVAVKRARPTDDPLPDRKLLISHPHVVVLRDVARTRSGEALVYAWAGTPLPPGPHPVELVVDLGRQLASALAALHAEGVVHWNVHPEHILVEAGHARLAGFGSARSAAVKTVPFVHKRPGAEARRFAFLSPEQARGLPVGPASDVFALGAVLASWRVGRAPFGADGMESLFDVLTAITTRDHALPDDPALQPLLAAMTAREPAARPTAAAVERELARIGKHDPTAND
jgi:uncharacterized protein (TIGR02996 family)